MITGIHVLKILTKHIPCECKRRFDGKNVIQISGGITVNVDVSEKTAYMQKEYVCNPSTCTCENGKCLANIMNDSAITYDEII